MKLGRRSRWLAGLTLFLLSTLGSKGQEDEGVIVPIGSDGWSYLDPVTVDNAGFDPALFDFDFESTWFDPLGVYLGGVPYDGPAFTEGAFAPFTREALVGFPEGGTILGQPEPETLGSFYLLKTIDGGDGGYRDLRFQFWAYDGCYIYLNGELAAVGNMDPNVPDTWSAPALLASPQFFYTPALPTRQVWLEPGPNLLAISVHNANPSDTRSGISLQITGTPGPPHPVKITRGPYLQKTTSETITVCWRTSHHANSKVSYGRASDLKWTVLSDPGFVLDREVTITGLLPDTSYYYSVESEDVRGTKVGAGGDEKGHWFRTAPSPGESKPTRIWVIGDSGTGLRLGGGVRDQRSRSVFEGFLDYTEDEPPDLWLMLGDNAYGSGTDQQYQEAVFETYAEIIGNTPIWPALGNHDSFNTPVYKSIFSLPTGGEAGGMPSGSELYYSFDHADIHFICLNSATRTSANPDISTVMYEWLEADLASTDQEWIIAYFHHGPYTKGSHDSDREVRHRWLRENAIPLLEDYGVDLILSGHSHAYERSMLIDGHYGRSENFDPTRMLIDGGNGSDVGSVSETGEFLEGLGMTGAYQKPAATGNAGAVYSTVGSSGRISRWTNGSNDLVNPEPHAVMLVNLLTLGSMVIEIDGVRLNAKFLDVEGEVRDDFTILKGSTVSLESTDPVFVETGSDETATFRFSRKGAVDIPLEVEFSLSGTADLTVDYVTPDPIGGLLTFAAGESEREITLRRVHDLVPEGRETVNLALRESRTYRSAENKRAVTAYLLEDPYEGWTMANFGVVNLGLGREPGDNPDGDQWSNLLEYALGGHPLIPDSGAGLIVRALGPFLVLEYPRDVTKPHLVYTVEASTNLVDWTTAPVTDSLVEPAGENGVELRRGLVFDKGEELPFRFLRLRVELAN